MTTPALLALADGTVFRGHSIGSDGSAVGEVVFNTAMTGYQEILTDPSYCQQIVTLTYPHIGNVGVNPDDEEARRIFASGLIVRDYSPQTSNWRATRTLADYLRARGVVAMAGVDTRRLTRLLREQGAQNGCLSAGPEADPAAAIAKAQAFPGLRGADLARTVSTEQSYTWQEGTWRLDSNTFDPVTATRYRVVAYDYGIKRNILRMLAERGCHVTVVPAATPAPR